MQQHGVASSVAHGRTSRRHTRSCPRFFVHAGETWTEASGNVDEDAPIHVCRQETRTAASTFTGGLGDTASGVGGQLKQQMIKHSIVVLPQTILHTTCCKTRACLRVFSTPLASEPQCSRPNLQYSFSMSSLSTALMSQCLRSLISVNSQGLMSAPLAIMHEANCTRDTRAVAPHPFASRDLAQLLRFCSENNQRAY
jgi:hypothetical protein